MVIIGNTSPIPPPFAMRKKGIAAALQSMHALRASTSDVLVLFECRHCTYVAIDDIHLYDLYTYCCTILVSDDVRLFQLCSCQSIHIQSGWVSL